MAKRGLDLEAQEVSEVVETSPNAKVEGVVRMLSPMKKSKTCSYFDGEISDGKSSMRIFGFDSNVRRKLLECKNPVALVNCEVKQSRQGQQLEVLVTKHTNVEELDKEFDVDEINMSPVSVKVIHLNELPSLVSFQRVTCEVKVISVEDEMEVTGGKRKQDVIVGDCSGTARLTLWESEIGRMVVDESYKLCGVIVREFRGKKFISTSKEKCTIEAISDIGTVEERESEDEDMFGTGSEKAVPLENVRVIGVSLLDSYSGCIKCAAKVLSDIEDPDLGSCVKCGTMQCVKDGLRELTAQLMLKTSSGGVIALRAFGKVVQDIAQKQSSQITKAILLKAKPFTIVHKEGIIRSVTRKCGTSSDC